MPYVLCDRITFKIKDKTVWDIPVADAGDIVFQVDNYPDGNERWNGDENAPALRLATAQELSNDVDAEKDTKADLPDEILKAFALVMLDEINALRADHGRATITPAQLKAAVKAKL